MNANDDDNSMLRNHIAEKLCDAKNNCNPRCHLCGADCESFVMDTACCLLTQGEDNVVKIQHLCSPRKIGNAYVCLGCLRYNCRKDKLRCACTKATTTATSAVAAPPKHDNNHGSHQQSVHYDACNGGFDDDQDQDYCFTNQRVIPMEGKIEQNFNDPSAFNKKCSKYFMNEHSEPNSGKKCLVEYALNKKNINTDDVNMALLTTHLHYNTTDDQSRDILQVTQQTVKELEKEKREDKQMLDELLKESISESLSKMISEMKTGAPSNGSDDLSEKMLSNVSELTENITNLTEKKMNNAKMENILQSNDLPEFNDIRNKYLEGKKSIVRNLPIPDVNMAHDFAYVPLEQTVNLFLAMGLPLRYYEDDSHWKDEDGKYEGEYFRSLHSKIKSDESYAYTRFYIARGWSDGFALHYVRINSDHNNLQLYTFTLLGEKGQPDHTWPFAIGFKQSDHSNILNMFLKQAKALETPKLRYVGGSERKLLRVSIHLQVMMNDYIERVANCFVSQNGNFAHRWGYSCFYCEKTTPSCESCRGKRIDRILGKKRKAATTDREVGGKKRKAATTDREEVGGKKRKAATTDREEAGGKKRKAATTDREVGGKKRKAATTDREEAGGKKRKAATTDREVGGKKRKAATTDREEAGTADAPGNSACQCCTDWWSLPGHTEKLTEYPVRIGNVKSIRQMEQTGNLKMIPVVKLNFEMLKNCVIEVKDHWDKFKTQGRRPTKIDIKYYFDICGIQQKFSEKMIAKLYYGDGNIEEMIPEIWDDVIGSGLDLFVQIPMHLCALGIEKTLIKNTKSFLNKGFLLKSGKDQIVTEVQEVHSRIIRAAIEWLNPQPFTSNDDLTTSNWLSDSFFAFTRTSLVLFGVLAENEDSELDAIGVPEHQEAFQEMRVLWFCLMSHMFADEFVSSDTIDDYSKLFLDACVRLHNLTKKKTNGGRRQKSFFETTCNFFSILNTKQVVDRHSSSRALWEGNYSGEKFIQKFKGANTTGFFRHNNRFMSTFTEKVMNNYMLDHINKDNPMRDRVHYARALNFKVYDDNASPLTQGIVVSGVIVNGRMYICFNRHNSSLGKNQVVLKELGFNNSAGQWHYNLFYAPAIIEKTKEAVICEDREDVIKRSSDVFALFHLGTISPNEVDSEKICFTMICRSWKIRDDDGKLRLPTPQEKLLRRGHIGFGDGDELSMEQDELEIESSDDDEQSNTKDHRGMGSKQPAKRRMSDVS